MDMLPQHPLGDASAYAQTNSKPVDSTQQNYAPGAAPARAAGLGKHYEITGQNEARKTDFFLQNLAAKLLKDAKNPKGKSYRVKQCVRAVISIDRGVDVIQGQDSRKAKYCGLQKCGSVWVCRACQRKILRIREREIKVAMERQWEAGGSCVMITFTHGHKKFDSLLSMVEKYAAAMSDMTSWREYKTLLAKCSADGRIRALETTFGWANGWHPHGHELHFLDREPLSEKECTALKKALFQLWKKACLKHGLPAPSLKYGVDVTPAFSASEYLCKFGSDQKWGAGKELTQLNSKKSKAGDDERFTPMDLLRAFEKGYKADTMKMLFQEFAHAYHGRRQLHWSKGLKARFGIQEMTDAEAEAMKEEEHTKVGNIQHDDWRRVIREANDARVQVLELVETHGFDRAVSFIASLQATTDFDFLGDAGGIPSPPQEPQT